MITTHLHVHGCISWDTSLFDDEKDLSNSITYKESVEVSE